MSDPVIDIKLEANRQLLVAAVKALCQSFETLRMLINNCNVEDCAHLIEDTLIVKKPIKKLLDDYYEERLAEIDKFNREEDEAEEAAFEATEKENEAQQVYESSSMQPTNPYYNHLIPVQFLNQPQFPTPYVQYPLGAMNHQIYGHPAVQYNVPPQPAPFYSNQYNNEHIEKMNNGHVNAGFNAPQQPYDELASTRDNSHELHKVKWSRMVEWTNSVQAIQKENAVAIEPEEIAKEDSTEIDEKEEGELDMSTHTAMEPEQTTENNNDSQYPMNPSVAQWMHDNKEKSWTLRLGGIAKMHPNKRKLEMTSFYKKLDDCERTMKMLKEEGKV